METMTRKGFVRAMGAMGGVLLAANAVTFARADEPSGTTEQTDATHGAAEVSETSWVPESKYPGETAKNPDVVPLVTSPAPEILSPEEVSDLLENEITVTEDYVKADGTVVPAAYINMRNKVNRNGIGIGSELTTDDHWDVWMDIATEEEAAAYAEMPDYVEFTAADYALKTGRPEDGCAQMCEELAEKGILHRVRRAGVSYYHTQTQEYGLYEARVNLFDKQYLDDKDKTAGSDNGKSFLDSGTSMYRTFPVDLSVVDGDYTEFDDWRAVLERNEVFSVSPCMCRTKQMMQAEVDSLAEIGIDCGHDDPIETCICTGEQAQFIIDIGAGRQIDRAEAEGILQGAVDRGMILESVFSRSAENICCCHADCCLNVGAVRLLNGGPAVENYSNFYLAHDTEACIQCGACVDQCPMHSIVMSEETGYPIVDNACVRCGQCALVCPAGARKLVLKPEEDRPYIPHTLLEDYKLKAQVRAAKGYLYDYPGQTAAAESAAQA